MTGDRVARIAFRLSFLVASAGLLFVVCRQGTSLLTVGLVFVVYVAAATLWVRGQYQASADAARQGDDSLRPWTFAYRTSATVAGAGLLVAVGGAVLNSGTALIGGALMMYLGLGYVLMRFRAYTGDGGPLRTKVGRLVLAVVLASVVVGLLLLETTSWAAILVAAVLLAPIGLSLVAEPEIRSLQAPGQGGRVALVAAAGFLLLAGDIAVAVARVDTWWIASAFLALALLVLAIVSSTQADIAVVIAAVALMGVTSRSEDKPAALRPERGQPNVLVALGDSYMSGEGADLYFDEGDRDHANHCNRAPTAWAAMAGQTKRLFDSVAFLACSGARTYNVRHGGTPQYNEPATQLDQVDALKTRLGGTLDPSLVVVGLGGNDAGFARIGMMCLAPGDCSSERDLWEQNLPRVGKALSATYGEIRREFPRAPVVVTAYPAPIYTLGGKPRVCDQVALSTGDMTFVSEFVTELNETVRRAAAANRFHFLGEMQDALADAHLQLCDPENDQRPGLNFIGLRSVGGVAEQRFNPKHWYHNSLHPNERGHSAMLQVFEQWLADHPAPERDAPIGGSASTEASGAPRPPCDLVRDAQSTTVLCDDEAARWVRGQIGDMMLWRWWGLQVAVATLAAWLLAVALFGWWRPWWSGPPPG